MKRDIYELKCKRHSIRIALWMLASFPFILSGFFVSGAYWVPAAICLAFAMWHNHKIDELKEEVCYNTMLEDLSKNHKPSTVCITLDGLCIVCKRPFHQHGSLLNGVVLCPMDNLPTEPLP